MQHRFALRPNPGSDAVSARRQGDFCAAGDPWQGLAGPASVLATVASRSCQASSAASGLLVEPRFQGGKAGVLCGDPLIRQR
jgi:hypothetical protein